MSTEQQPLDPNDPNTWPLVECESADVFIDTDEPPRENPHLTDEQKLWPLVECESADVFIDTDRQPAPPKPPQQPGL